MNFVHLTRKLVSVAISVIVVGCFVSLGNASTAYASSSYGELKVVVSQNYADAQKVLKLVNKERAKAGLGKLKMDKKLTKGSILRAAEVGIFVPWDSSHPRPNGKTYKSVNSRFVYECCAEGDDSPEDVVEGWMGSPSHRAGILLRSAKSVGIACVTTGIDTIWVLDFSNTKATSVQKSKKKVTYVKTVKAKSNYIKKKFFKLVCFDPSIVGEKYYAGIDYSSSYNVTKTDISAKSFKWKSSNPSIATVSKNGLVTPKAPGKVTITAKMKSNPKIALKRTFQVYEDWQSYYDSLGDEYGGWYLMAANAAQPMHVV